MPADHLRALQAIEAAMRLGSFKAAAGELGVTPAAVGQRIATLERYLGAELIRREHHGLRATPELERALPDLRAGFAALDRAGETLALQRLSEIHVVADPDLAELWLAPRLPRFRERHPAIRFNVNGKGDVPMRLGAPDCRIALEGTAEARQDATSLFRDRWVPVGSPLNVARVAVRSPERQIEGFPLVHLEAERAEAAGIDWPRWCAARHVQRHGAERGMRYRRVAPALRAVADHAGLMVCGLALAAEEIAAGRIILPVSATDALPAPARYVAWFRPEGLARPALRRFHDWLLEEASATQAWLRDVTAPEG